MRQQAEGWGEIFSWRGSTFPGRIPISGNYRPLLIQRTVARKGPSVFVNHGRVIGQEGNTHGVLPCSCVTVATAQKHKPKVMYSASRCLRLLRSWSAERKPLFFPTFSPGWEVDSLWTLRSKANRSSRQRGTTL